MELQRRERWGDPEALPHLFIRSSQDLLPATSRGSRSKQEMMPRSKSEPDLWIPGWAEDPSDFPCSTCSPDLLTQTLHKIPCPTPGEMQGTWFEEGRSSCTTWTLALGCLCLWSQAQSGLLCDFLCLISDSEHYRGSPAWSFEHSWSSGWGFSCRGKISLVQIQSAVPTHLDYCTHHKCWGFCYSHFRVKVFSMCILSLRGSQLRGIDAKACTSPKSHGSLLLQARDQRKPTVNQSW